MCLWKFRSIDLSSQEGDLWVDIHGCLYLIVDFEFVSRLFLENEGCVLGGSLNGSFNDRATSLLWESAESCWLKSCGSVWAEGAFRLSGLGYTSYRGLGSILAEKFGVGHGLVVEFVVIVAWDIEVFTTGRINLCIIFGDLYIPVIDPSKFPIHISIFLKLCIVWHSCAFDLVFLIWIKLPLYGYQDLISISKIFGEILLQQTKKV